MTVLLLGDDNCFFLVDNNCVQHPEMGNSLILDVMFNLSTYYVKFHLRVMLSKI